MQNLNIKSHKPGREYSQPHFFILNKGNNSGKPLKSACPNCFVFTFKSIEDKEFYYSLIFGIWQAKSFHYYLRGSVIPFISLVDLKKCIIESQSIANDNLPEFKKSVSSLKTLEELEKQYLQNLLLINEAKKMVFYKYILRK